MGISGLLQFIKDAGEPVNVKKYKGQAVAVDTYCWLHKGAFSCADKLAKGEPTDQYVWYCMKFVDMLLNFGVKPILVFDGRNLPSKREVEKSRRERREANLQKGRQLLREGKLSEARECFTRCVNITPDMAHNLIKAARARGVDCIVAPYEADAQLAHLTKTGLAQAVITEDSDLLAFGCKKVILKMDRQGNGLEIDQSNLGRCRSLGNVFTEEKFRHMCILSGCDYLSSLHGIGLGKACKLLRLARDPDILKVIRKMGQYLKMNLVVPEEYLSGFVRANNTFLYQLVFDPVTRKVVPLNSYPDHVDPSTLSYAGLHLGDDTGLQMALGNLDINTLKPIDNFNPDKPTAPAPKPRSRSWSDAPAPSHLSIWSRGANLPPADTPAAPSADRPPSTRGKERVVGLQGLKLPSRELQLKRPREDSGVSDQDVLDQYSSSQKRPRSEETPGTSKPAAMAQPRLRNRFSTLLQRRNQQAEGEERATCSRFFSSSAPVLLPDSDQLQEDDSLQRPPPAEDKPHQQDSDVEGPEVPSVETPSPSPPSAGSQGLNLFQWSGRSPLGETLRKSTSALSALQQFQYKKECVSSLKTSPDSEDELSHSPPSQDSAYFSQSQSRVSPVQPEEESSSDLLSQREDTSSRSDPAPRSSPPRPGDSRATHRPKVSRSLSLGQGSRGRGLGPARASGLRRTSKKSPSSSNENSPAVQATISSLWKNFSFSKHSPKVAPCKKGAPLSPVEDNLLTSSPAADLHTMGC
ncbi:exonuclease 1 isoform X1 [Synchiropus splendidus]|uniref:exonuclease 1 isoform X1 n=1 Tax=Synchiropus splendidus TaxID=270530 RepID=UPI00237D8824|nr:exonuclease 1 isoform X1 [Synchiropus splendidus]